MPWLYVDPEKGVGRASVTDDDSNEIGILTNYTLHTSFDEAQAEFQIIVTDLPGWIAGFHKPMLGPS